MRVRTEAKRIAILDAAAQVFMELGYERTSMSEIAARLGGSKATLYGYFSSKEDLFARVVYHIVGSEIEAAFLELSELAGSDPEEVLTRFGERVIVAVTSAKATAARRMVIAESGVSDIGQRFWNIGPQKNLDAVAAYLVAATAAGRLNVKDSENATLHLFALYESELGFRWLFGIQRTFTRQQIRQAVGRAVEVFLAAYGVSSSK